MTLFSYTKKLLTALALLVLCAQYAAANGAPPPDKRSPKQALAMMILDAHERDTGAVLDAVDMRALHEKYRNSGIDAEPVDFETFTELFSEALNAKLSGAGGEKLDNVLKNMNRKQKFNLIEMYINAYTRIDTNGDDAVITLLKSEQSTGNEKIYMRRADKVWRVVWIEPFDQVWDEVKPPETAKDPNGKPAPEDKKPAPQPAPQPQPRPEPEEEAPMQVIVALLQALVSLDAETLAACVDLKSVYNRLVERVPALKIIDYEKFESMASAALVQFGRTLKAALPEELLELSGEGRGLAIDYYVRAHSRVEVKGSNATVRFLDFLGKGRDETFSLKKSNGKWKINWAGFFDKLDIFK